MKTLLLLTLLLLAACQAPTAVDKTEGPKTCFCEEDTLARLRQFTGLQHWTVLSLALSLQL